MDLKDFLTTNGISARAFAKKLNVCHSTILNYISGKTIPRRIIMEKIKEVTYGKVREEDFRS